MRAVLLNRGSGSTLLLTFDHTIADGISSVRVMADVLTALNGKTLVQRPIPPSVEEVIARGRVQTELSNPTDAPDARMSEPTSIRPFDGTHPYLHAVALEATDTARLVTRCRAEKTTVHAAILTAASRVHATLHNKDFVRSLSPIDVRPLLGIDADCADHFMCTITGMAPWDGTAFWDQARAMTAHLSVARSGPGIAAASAAIQQEVTVDAECALAEQLFTVALPFELLITNLGVQELVPNGPIKPVALWGPIVQSQVDDYVIGIVTYSGRLRMTSSGYTPSEGFLRDVAATLIEAAQRRDSGAHQRQRYSLQPSSNAPGPRVII